MHCCWELGGALAPEVSLSWLLPYRARALKVSLFQWLYLWTIWMEVLLMNMRFLELGWEPQKLSRLGIQQDSFLGNASSSIQFSSVQSLSRVRLFVTP